MFCLKIRIAIIIVFFSMLWFIDLAMVIDNCDNETCNSTIGYDEKIWSNLSISCNSTTLKPISLCASQNTTYPISITNIKETRCFCDSDCDLYDDCCVDKKKNKTVNKVNPWSCRDVNPFVSPISIYMIQKCSVEDVNPILRMLCEEEITSMQEKQYQSHLQWIPVHSNMTNLIYRNIFCAICNNDNLEITKWETYMHCTGIKELVNPHSENFTTNFFKDSIYYPKSNRWIIHFPERKRYCRLILSEFIFSNWEDLSQKYGARICKPFISTCLSDADPFLHNSCQSYTSYVYKEISSTKVDIYKNFHCALCNKVLDAICYDSSISRIYAPLSSDKIGLALLFDFNFFGENNGNQIGQTSNCVLSNGQVWDPLLQQCLNISCGKLYERKNGRCVPLKIENNFNESVIENECRKIVLKKEYFTVLQNKSVYINYSEKTYAFGSYEVYKTDEIHTWLEILICDENALVFEFPTTQVWFSEVTLGLSVTCLVLHLLVYSLLPTLRNRPGKILMSLSAALVCGHLFLLLGPHFRQIYWLCYVNAIFMYFGYLSSFFWMNVMAFDIYRTFATKVTKSNSSGNKTFVKYSGYVWLSTICIVLLSLCVDHLASLDSSINPKFAEQICWFNTKRGLLLFFVTPISILLICNFSLFGTTALNIRVVAKQTKLVNTFTEKKRYLLYIKLAIVLGLTWIFGFIAAFTRIEGLWYPFIILNGLQGVFIFVIFTVKKKIFHLLVIKLKLRSHKYSMDKKSDTKAISSSLSNLTTLQTSLTSTLSPAVNPNMLIAIRQLKTSARE